MKSGAPETVSVLCCILCVIRSSWTAGNKLMRGRSMSCVFVGGLRRGPGGGKKPCFGATARMKAEWSLRFFSCLAREHTESVRM